ncbi:MarR family transcriptional regulator [Desulfosporosinus fructosivorans]|uniref:MarR family transcriptional regulator n=1 Tax=Desulfosporosinus fructosivorans TaxID=2018669 RepID=A0A4Z0QX36_9FIRM|nr:MarR family transcriptional regulator [Desulfosporosinus fructosivorans]TGE35361.1 MarR family transcriptional regulator [Desulfosporosinus fructosivorans]
MQNDEILLMIKEFSNVSHEFNSKTFKFIDDQLNKTGLVRTHFRMLQELVDGKELSMSDLSEILHVTKPNITVLTDKLVKLDYVERVNSSRDRRVFLIRITDEGKKFMNKSAEELIKSSARFFGNLDDEDLELIKQTTQAMKKLLSKFNKE